MMMFWRRWMLWRGLICGRALVIWTPGCRGGETGSREEIAKLSLTLPAWFQAEVELMNDEHVMLL